MGQLVVPSSGVKPGTVAYFAADTPPPGWLACDGATVSAQDFAALFAAIGTTFGDGGAASNRLNDPTAIQLGGFWSHTANAVVTADTHDAPGVAGLVVDTLAANGANCGVSQFTGFYDQPQAFSFSVKRLGGDKKLKLYAQLGAVFMEARINFDTASLEGINASAGILPTLDTLFVPEENDFYRVGISHAATGQPLQTFGVQVVDAAGANAGAPGDSFAIGGFLVEPTAMFSDFWGSGIAFNLPDLRGEFIRGLDAGRGIDAGRVFGSAQADDFKAHTHSSPYPPDSGASSGVSVPQGSTAPTATVTGSTGGAETRPRNVALLPCIKY